MTSCGDVRKYKLKVAKIKLLEMCKRVKNHQKSLFEHPRPQLGSLQAKTGKTPTMLELTDSKPVIVNVASNVEGTRKTTRGLALLGVFSTLVVIWVYDPGCRIIRPM